MKYAITIYSLFSIPLLFCSCNLGLTKCRDVKEWQINKYKIVKSECLGVVGPHYYPFSLYSSKKFIARNGFQKDSCTITFQADNDLYVVVNTCGDSVAEITPTKKPIKIADVDSVLIFSNELQQTRWLSNKKIKNFARDWNKSKASDYRDEPEDSIFFPAFQYKLTVYSKGNKQEFTCFNFLINDRTKWTYYISGNEDVEYFNKLWKY